MASGFKKVVREKSRGMGPEETKQVENRFYKDYRPMIDKANTLKDLK